MPAGLKTTTPTRLLSVVRDGVDDVLGRGAVFGAQPLGRHIDPAGVRGYYCDFRRKSLQHLADPGFFADFVIPVAQTALGHWERMLEGEDLRDAFMDRVGWLVRRAEPAPDGAGLVWRCDLPMHKYELGPGWISAMGQSEAISVLLRAHQLTGDEHYVELAGAAFEPLTRDVTEGGAARRIDGHLVLEEYATVKPAAILNGWVFALFGVHELAVATGNERARSLFAESVAGLLALLPRYDIGWWSLYSLYDHDGRADLAKPFYQRLHPVLLTALDQLHPDPGFALMADRWRGQLGALPVARNVAAKIAFRLAWERRARPNEQRAA